MSDRKQCWGRPVRPPVRGFEKSNLTIPPVGMATIILLALMNCWASALRPAIAQEKTPASAYLSNLPFKMEALVEPKLSPQVFNIKDYGAVPDGRTLNTQAVASAIDACVKAGGGTIVVPPGTWLCASIKLESGVNFHLERGALIQFSHRFEDFPLIAGFDGKSKRFQVTPPLWGYRLHNVAITGEGVFDGAGEYWRPVKKEKQTVHQWKELVSSGGVVSPDGKVWWPSKEAMEGEELIAAIAKSPEKASKEEYARAREFLRPDLVQLVQCENVLIDGPTFRNSPRFHLHPIQSEKMIIRNIMIQSDWWAQNGDGLDLSACRDVLVYNAAVDVGDDGICLKPGRIAKSQNPGPSCERIVIADCAVYHAHGGFVIGSESQGGAANISVHNCLFIGTDVGLRFKSLRGKGGIVEKVYVDNIQMRGIGNEAILFDMLYGGDSPEIEATKPRTEGESSPVNELTPTFRNFAINHIVCTGAGRALLINGLPEMPVRDIRLDDVNIESDKGVLCVDADSIVLSNASIISKASPEISLYQVSNSVLRKILYPEGMENFLYVDGGKSKNIRLIGIDLHAAKEGIKQGQSVGAGAVIGEK